MRWSWLPASTNASTCVCFFSSRRRHTRCSRDWSSDVCSSDLYTEGHPLVRATQAEIKDVQAALAASSQSSPDSATASRLYLGTSERAALTKQQADEIGRASCRERV